MKNKLIIGYPEYKNLVADICREISISDWTPDYVVGITRGGLTAAVMISHYFNKPCHTLQVSLKDWNLTETNAWMAEDAYNGVKILIVDDINDSGATINWILEDWQGSAFPKDEIWNTLWNNNVRFASIVDNTASNCNVKIDYAGYEINKVENDVWVEFPYENFWKK